MFTAQLQEEVTLFYKPFADVARFVFGITMLIFRIVFCLYLEVHMFNPVRFEALCWWRPEDWGRLRRGFRHFGILIVCIAILSGYY